MIKLPARSSRFYLYVSVAAAVLAALCLIAYLQGMRSRIAESGRLVRLVVAARDLGAGEVVDASSLELVDFPDVYLLPGTYTDTLALEGETLRSAVGKGEPLLESCLVPPGGSGLALQSLDRGFRAYPLESSAISFPAGELHAGCRVDILAISGDGASPLLQNIEVLHVYGITAYSGGSEAAGIGGYGGECILLQLTCEEACRLATAQEGGKVELLLRAAGEGAY